MNTEIQEKMYKLVICLLCLLTGIQDHEMKKIIQRGRSPYSLSVWFSVVMVMVHQCTILTMTCLSNNHTKSVSTEPYRSSTALSSSLVTNRDFIEHFRDKNKDDLATKMEYDPNQNKVENYLYRLGEDREALRRRYAEYKCQMVYPH